MKNRYFLCIVFLILTFSAFAQVTGQSSGTMVSGMNMTEIIMLARSSADYRVTAGDVYTLTYAVGTNAVTYAIVVDSSYRIRVSNLGVVNGAGKTFIQLKNEVETIVANNYPLSGVQLVLTQPSIFKVHVKGEVTVAEEVSVWALSRLSSLISTTPIAITTTPTTTTPATTSTIPTVSSLSSTPPKISLTALSSLRDISVRSSNGQTRVYDLFLAQRLGDVTQDPYLRPGDEITFNRIERVVTIRGQVERTGTYQLLDEENIKELIEFYGNGFRPTADSTRIEIIRRVDSDNVAGDKIFLTENDLAKNFALENYDTITVPTITQLRPVMFVEGAVINASQMLSNTEDTITSAEDPSVSNRLAIRFEIGETYASLVRRNITWFTAVSDTQNAYVLRNDERLPVNLNPMLYDASYRSEVLIVENDILVIPFRQYFVTVAGAVMNPGRYPFISDRNWEYYVALAGGFVPERNTRETIVISDINGKRMRKTDAILPETIITARTNHGLYYFNQYAPVVVTILSLITTFFSIQRSLRGSSSE
jgi:protein involved in polysaccharide export with SLBB domain